MRYNKLTDEQKLTLIERKLTDIYILIRVITDALEFRVLEESENHYDCISFLRRAQTEIRCLKKLF